jgi:7,8-dihydro-6-hydroxymethylpterin dimethyltransferase
MSDVSTAPRRRLSLLQPEKPAVKGSAGAILALRADLGARDLSASVAFFELGAHTRVLKTTISLCPECLSHVPAIVFTRGGRVLMRKRCAVHGPSLAVLENDERFYFLSNKDVSGRTFAPDRVFDIPPFAAPGASACCAEGETCGPTEGAQAGDGNATGAADATDQLANKTCTVLVEVTDACNLACPVCYSDAKGNRKMPRADFERYILGLLDKKGGLDSVQLTGGEAMLHPDFWQLVGFLYAEPRVKKIYLPTNGILLARPEVAARLAPFASRMMVLLQFDGASDETDRALRSATPARVRQDVIANLGRLGVPMQLTMTLAANVNAEEVGAVVDVGLRNEHVKVIALQPATYSGRYELTQAPEDRLTLSDMIKAVARQARIPVRPSDFVPIPCSHPNCGWITLFVRRFGIVRNVVRYVDLQKVLGEVAYKTLLSTDELKGALGTASGSWLRRAAGWSAKRLVRSTDVFTVAIKPFMDRYSYDEDRIANCCHHTLDTHGRVVSFCEYNARGRQKDSWERLPVLG